VQFAFDLAHGYAIVRESEIRIGGAGALADRSSNLRDGQRIDELR